MENVYCTKGNKSRKGFTLVELSVVIVITGLITAGVTAGKSLVASSKLRSQVTDLQKYNVAFNGFYDQYKAIAGDMKDASAIWTGAMNGNGDGKLSYDSNWAHMSDHENITPFQHLSRAKLIDGTYNASVWAIGTGYPRLKIDSSKGMIAAGFTDIAGNAGSLQLSATEATRVSRAALHLAVGQPGAGSSAYNDFIGVMSPIQASNIDIKIDDGVARSGLFRGYRAWSSTKGNCLTGNDGSYLITNSDVACDAEYVVMK